MTLFLFLRVLMPTQKTPRHHNFKDDDYYWVTAKLCAIAVEVCKGRVVSTLEGG